MPEIALHRELGPIQATRNPLPRLLRTPFGLALIEIQGSLNLPDKTATDTRPDAAMLQIGRLEFTSIPTIDDPTVEQAGPWMKNVYLYVGDRQRLAGEVKKLEKAFAVIRRREQSETDDFDEDLEVADIIRYKLHFGGRPEFV